MHCSFWACMHALSRTWHCRMLSEFVISHTFQRKAGYICIPRTGNVIMYAFEGLTGEVENWTWIR